MDNKQTNSPMVGYTKSEFALIIGQAVLNAIEDNGMEIVWQTNHNQA